MSTQQTAIDLMFSTVSPGELAILDRPQAILEDPEPRSKRAQQVRRLQEHGHKFYKAAGAVKVCGRLGKKLTYKCGREYVKEIIRAHLRFCCEWCDKSCASKLFEEHKIYRAFLNPSGTLHRVTIRSGQYLPSCDTVNDFENASIKAVQGWLRRCVGRGFKAYTHYEKRSYVIKGMIYLPPGTSLPPDDLKIPSGTCTVDSGVSVASFEEMLGDMLKPTLSEGNGVLRAELMAAFCGGRHLHSSGVLNGKTTQKRKEKRLEREQEKLHLIEPSQSGATFVEPDGTVTSCAETSDIRTQDALAPLESGATSIEHQNLNGTHPADVPVQTVSALSLPAEPLARPQDRAQSGPPCPHCGPGCQLISVSVVPMSDLQDTPWYSEARLPRGRTMPSFSSG